MDLKLLLFLPVFEYTAHDSNNANNRLIRKLSFSSSSCIHEIAFDGVISDAVILRSICLSYCLSVYLSACLPYPICSETIKPIVKKFAENVCEFIFV